MPNQKYLAVIDLGTNTFHLLVVHKCQKHNGFVEEYRDRRYVLLAENGINAISEQSLIRAYSAIDQFAITVAKYHEIEVKIVGTDALRYASNGFLISDYVLRKFALSPDIISGDREAELIYKGNKLVIDSNYEPYLIMDIGGGSTEFILVDKSGVVFSNSYPLGVTRMYNMFNDKDPISTTSSLALETHIESVLFDLSQGIGEHNISSLVGASGSFEVLSLVLKKLIPQNSIVDIQLEDFYSLAEKVLNLNIDERRLIDGIPESRIKLIPIAFVMIRKIISMYKPNKVGVSPFALKEGLIAEWLNSQIVRLV